MATPVKKAENMKKHMTIAEREKREQAEQELERRFVRLIAPKRVKEDSAANAYWKSTIARMKGLTLLDNVDTDLLASYCLARAREDALRDDAAKDVAGPRAFGDRLPEGTWPHAERPPEAGQAARHRASSDGGG